MSTTTLKTRIALKVDTLENWNNSSLKLLNGEVAIATAAISAEGNVGVTEPVTLIKVGTAEEKTFSELPFSLYAKASDVLSICKNEAALAQWVKDLVSGEYSETLVKLREDIDLLNGNADTEGSVAHSIKAAIDALKLSETYETIANVDLVRERVSKIETSLAEGGDTAKAIKAAQDAADAAQQDVDDLAKYVGTIPNDTEGRPVADDVIGYINKKTDGIATDENLTILAGRVSANEAAITAINDEETGILKQAKNYVDAEDKFEIDMTTINALGGIAAGSDLNNMTTHDILKKLLYPYVDASVGNATAGPSNGGTVEVGSTQTITSVSISVTKKSEPITSVVLYNGSTELYRKEGSAIANGTNTFNKMMKDGEEVSLSVPVTATSATSTGKLKVIVTYPGADGAAKTATKETGAFTFVFPYYYGVCGAADALDASLFSSLTKDVKGKGEKTYNYTTDAQRMVIAYPKAHGTLKLVKDGNGLDNTGAFGSPVTVSFTNSYGVTADYYIYANGVTSGSAKMTFTHN